jgi:hypothetical protein
MRRRSFLLKVNANYSERNYTREREAENDRHTNCALAGQEPFAMLGHREGPDDREVSASVRESE